jgi:hypothetical protein
MRKTNRVRQGLMRKRLRGTEQKKPAPAIGPALIPLIQSHDSRAFAAGP